VKWRLLDSLSEEDARVVIAATRRRSFRRGEPVFHEGDSGSTLHLVDKGRVAIRVTTPMGEVATLRIHGPGDYFGELAVVAPGPRMASVVALEPVETLALQKDEFDRLRKTHPGVDAMLIESLVGEIRRVSAQLVDALYLPAPERLMTCLAELGRLYGDGSSTGAVTVPLTQDDLAGLCGTTRSTMNQMLQRLADRGLLTVGRGKLVLQDLAEINRRAGASN
jgi:CRP-like cAMP-binding protein